MAGVDHQIGADIQRDIWEKMVLLATFAGLTALMRLPIGPLRENAGTRVMSRAALDEAHAVARAKGTGLPRDFVERTLAGCDGLPFEMKSSILQDLERGRRLELPWLSGTIAHPGQELGTPPYSCLHHHRTRAACGGPRWTGW